MGAERETDKGTGKKRILAIDDAAFNLRKIEVALNGYYDVITVNSGLRALKYLEMEKPDLILLDIRMAPKDGFETLNEIRAMKNRADIPVIMLTGMDNEKSVVESIRLGICDYVLKPFSSADLLGRIRRVLESGEQKLYGERQK